MTKRIFGILALATIIALSCASKIQNEKPPCLLLVSCDGTLEISDGETSLFKSESSKKTGDVLRGAFYNGRLFAFDDVEMIAIDLTSTKSITIADISRAFDSNPKLWLIGYVDNESVYFSAYRRIDGSEFLGRKHYYCDVYRFDRNNGKTARVEIPDCASPIFSVYKDRIYYVNSNDNICVFHNGEIVNLEIKGSFPHISPDGKIISFASFGIIRDHVYLYDMENHTQRSLIGFLGYNIVAPIIRWSGDGNYLAVQKESDLTAGTIYIINVSSGRIVRKISDHSACNWFFTDENN